MADRISQPRLRQMLRAGLISVALLFPVSSGGPVLAEEANPSDAFLEGFDFLAIPEPEAVVVPGAVDVTEIDIPIEVEAPSSSLGYGVASFYGRRFHGRLTANGERFDMHAMTAAHRTLPFGSRVRVTNPRNGRSVIVVINDRGPFIAGRTIDLSRAAAKEIGIINRGHARVELELLSA